MTRIFTNGRRHFSTILGAALLATLLLSGAAEALMAEAAADVETELMKRIPAVGWEIQPNGWSQGVGWEIQPNGWSQGVGWEIQPNGAGSRSGSGLDIQSR